MHTHRSKRWVPQVVGPLKSKLPLAHMDCPSCRLSVGLMRCFMLLVLVYLMTTPALAACIPTPSYQGLHLEPPLAVPAIVGTDLRARPYNSDHLQDQIKVVFFGYTFCPDICPGIMHVVAEAYAALPRQQDQIEVIFVTVDPERDTPARMEAYLSTFHADFQGVRVEDAAMLEALKTGFGIFVESHRETHEDSSYLVDHTTRTYVLDPQGRMILTYGGDMEAASLARDLRKLLRN